MNTSNTQLQEIHNFSLTIENLAIVKRISLMDAVMLYCDRNGMEYELAAKMISKPLKKKIEVEAIGLRLVKDEREYDPLW